MPATQPHVVPATARQFAGALVHYERELGIIVAGPMDADRYRDIGVRMDEMRMYAMALPALSVPWVEVLIRHFELMHALWQESRELRGRDDMLALLVLQGESLRVLRLRCLDLVSRPPEC